MQTLVRPLLFILALVLVPVVPFLLFGEQFEQALREAFTPPPPDGVIASAVVAALSTDIFLPIPSSFVSTFAGMQLSVPVAVVASWVGMTLGASLGYLLARWLGRPLAVRFTQPEELDRMHLLIDRFGISMLVLTRAVPVFAETGVLLAGTVAMPWWRFFTPVALSNLGVSAAYVMLGSIGAAHRAELVAIAASIGLPVIAAILLRVCLPRADARSPAAGSDQSLSKAGASPR